MSPRRAVAYLRTSVSKRNEPGMSIEVQRAKVEAYAALYDVELVEVVVDAGASAKSLDREGLNRALSMLRTGKAEALLVVKLDRLTRSVRDLGELVETYFDNGKWALLSVSEKIDTRSAAGRLVLNVLASVGQWEREAIGERTAAAMAHKKAQGDYCGGDAPYGYAVEDGRLVPVESEQAVLAAAREARAAGLSLRTVACVLAERGFRTRAGGAFAAVQVSRMVAETEDGPCA